MKKKQGKAHKKAITLQEENKIEQKCQAIFEKTALYGEPLSINSERLCKCSPTHINCMSPKDWLKAQIGVWQFFLSFKN